MNFLAIAFMLAVFFAAPAAVVGAPTIIQTKVGIIGDVVVVVVHRHLRRGDVAPKRLKNVRERSGSHECDVEQKGLRYLNVQILAKLLRVKKFKFGKTGDLAINARKLSVCVYFGSDRANKT